jgi:FkbM family methyltransferase
MDIQFILRNYLGVIAARVIELRPSLLDRLRDSRSKIKPFIVRRLSGNRLMLVREVKIGNLRVRLHLSEHVQREIYLNAFEVEEVEACRQMMPAGGTAVDVGGNIGWVSLNLADAAGPAGRVISFEPDPSIADQLKYNRDLNGFQSRIEIVCQALGEHPGEIAFNRASGENKGLGSIVSAEGSTEQIKVPVTTLDRALAERGISKIDFLKIDVEGFEFSVLAGAEGILSRKAIANIMIEWNGVLQTRQNRTIDEFCQILLKHGYVMLPASVRQIESFREGKEDPKTTLSNLFFRRG